MSCTHINYVGQFTQSEATAAQRTFSFVAVDATDGLTLEPGLTYAGADCLISKNNGAFGNLAGTVTENASTSVYTVVLAAGDLDTIGTCIVKFIDAAARTVWVSFQVIAQDLNVALTPSTIADQVWDETLTSHTTTNTFGLAAVQASSGQAGNTVVDNFTYDSAGMMTACRFRIFSSAANAEAATLGGTAETGTVAVYTIAATGSNGRATLYRSSED